MVATSNSEVIAAARNKVVTGGPTLFTLTVKLSGFDKDDTVLVDCVMTQAADNADGYVLARGFELISLDDDGVEPGDDFFTFPITARARDKDEFADGPVQINTTATYAYTWVTAGLPLGAAPTE